MSINLDSAARAKDQWAPIEDPSGIKRPEGYRDGQTPAAQQANGRVVEDQLKQLKALAASDGPIGSMLQDGALATLDKLMMMLRKMQGDSRDMWREFAADQQQTAHTMRVTAFETRMTAIEKTHSAAMTQGFSQILSGIVSVGGSVTGNQVISMGTSGFGKTAEGFGTMLSASQTREAQINQTIADFQQGNADDFRKTLDSAIDKANEASRQMREWAKELVELQNRIMSAVRF